MQIDKNIPIPARHKKTNLRPIFEALQVGDSVLIDQEIRNQAAVYAAQAGIKIVTRAEKGTNKVRVWRVSDMQIVTQDEEVLPI